MSARGITFFAFFNVIFFAKVGWKCMAMRVYSSTTRSPIPIKCAISLPFKPRSKSSLTRW